MGPQTLVAFHSLPRLQRSEVILPEALLERIPALGSISNPWSSKMSVAYTRPWSMDG